MSRKKLLAFSQADASNQGQVAGTAHGRRHLQPGLKLVESTGADGAQHRTDRYGRSYVIGPAGVPAGLCPAFRVSHDGSAYSYLAGRQ